MIAARVCCMCLLLGPFAGCAESPPPPAVIESFEIPTEPPTPDPDESGARYVARWNAWVATIPPESIGRVQIREASDAFFELREEVGRLGQWDVWTATDMSKPGDEDWEATVELFELLEPQLDAMADGIAADWFVGSIEPTEPVYLVQSPAASGITDLFIDSSMLPRRAALQLAARARHRMLLGDADGFTRDILTVIDSKRHNRLPPLLVGLLTERATSLLISERLSRALALNPDMLSVEQLDEIVSALDRVGAPDLDAVLALEEAYGRWSLQHLFAGHEDGRLPRKTRLEIHEMFVEMAPMLDFIRSDHADFPRVPDSPPRRLATLEQHTQMNARLNNAILDLSKSSSEGTGPNPIRALIEHVRATDDLDGYYIVFNAAATMRSVAGGVHRDKLGHRALRCVIAIHRHRLVKGDWPAALSDLADQSLTIDPYTNEPFGYSVRESGPTLWAAGPDRDDDGGRATPDRSAQNSWFTLSEWAGLGPERQAAYDGDIVFFPPEPEPDRDDL